LGLVVRLVLLPTEGLRDDLDQFAGWIHLIATNGLGSLYRPNEFGPVTFGPVMGVIWGVLSTVQPAFQTVTDASDPAIRALMKLPASMADIGLALLAAYALRRRPGWAVVAVVAILLHPAVVDVSAWWGQYESIYVLFGLAALVFALNGHNGPAAVAVALALMTKPQAVAFVIPFAAWFWATGGWREIARTAAIGVATIVIVWLPFIAAGGPRDYLANLSEYQSEIFAILSLRAWNAWWLVQTAAAGGNFIPDDVTFLGPLALRHVGYLVTAICQALIAIAIVRDARPRTLILGLTASVLVVFAFMTQMHERYAYGAAIFVLLLIPESRIRWLAIGIGIVFTLNLLAAVPPTPGIGAALPVAGALGTVGSVVMISAAVIALIEMRRRADSG
jgi:hypothetical protein